MQHAVAWARPSSYAACSTGHKQPSYRLVDGEEQQDRRDGLRHHGQQVVIQAVYVRILPVVADAQVVDKLLRTAVRAKAGLIKC